MSDPRIAIAASPREWAQALRRHVADHGGALMRATVLHGEDALAEDIDVLVVDDTTSFLSRRLVAELHERGCDVLGVFDPSDPLAKDELVACGVDDVIERDAPPAAFLALIHALAGGLDVHPRGEAEWGDTARPPVMAGIPPKDTPPDATPTRPVEPPRRGRGLSAATSARGAPAGRPGRVIAVAGVAGGVGATEVAVGLATSYGTRGDATVLVDGDDVAPALAQRLGLALYPNIRAAIDALDARAGALADTLAPVSAGRFAALTGLSSPRGWADLRPLDVGNLLRALATVRSHVLCNVGHRTQDLPGIPGSPARYATPRHVLATADATVAVVAATPVGLTRLLDWLADLRDLPAAGPLHVAVNRAPADRARRREISAEIARHADPVAVTFLPEDPRVAEAAWRGVVTGTGPFMRAVAELADAVSPAQAAAPGRGRR